ncbi:Protein SYG1 [Paramyrothecium foliicola]|nr:Protein SYG1 [Paramyrothecium foliicola]
MNLLPHTPSNFQSEPLRPIHASNPTSGKAGADLDRPASAESNNTFWTPATHPVPGHHKRNEDQALTSNSDTLQYGSFVATPPKDNPLARRADHDFALPAPALRAPDSPDVAHHAPKNKDSLPRYLAQRSATMASLPSSSREPRSPRDQLLRRPTSGTFNGERLSPLKSLLSHAGGLGSRDQTRSDVGMRNFDLVREREREFWEFLDSELEKVETFYKLKEEQAAERLIILREQLHEMRNRRIREMSEPVYRDDPSPRDESIENNNGQDKRNGWVHPIKAKIFPPGPNSKGFQTMVQTPHMLARNHGDASRDYIRRPRDEEVSYRTAKRKLKLALQEFYRSLELLKSYALLNRTAFRKLNKKYDKAVNARPPFRYMNEKVHKAWFVNSEIIDGQIQAVEDLYARYFERGNHKLAAGKLRSLSKKSNEESGSSFLNGFLSGTGLVFTIQGLIAGTELLEHSDPTRTQQTSFLLQIYGGYFLMLLMMGLFCINCLIWQRNKINYPFIFEFDQRSVLDWRRVAEFPSFFLLLFGIFLWMNFSEYRSEDLFLYYPVFLIGITVIIIFLPGPVLAPKSRRWFAIAHGRLLLAGIFGVEFRDFFLGDIYCSLTYATAIAAIWDLFMDFSLLQAHSRHVGLRDIMALKSKWPYYGILVVDPVLRFSWIFYAIFTHDRQHSTIVSFLVALMEVFRRWMWAIFRVENEHCANVAQYKASRDVPLPYRIEPLMDRASHEASPVLPTGEQQQQRLERQRQRQSEVDPDRFTASSTAVASTPGTMRRRPDSSARSFSKILAEAHKQDFEKKRRPDEEVVPDDGVREGSEDEDDDSASLYEAREAEELRHRADDAASFPLRINLLPVVEEALEELVAQARVEGAGGGANRVHAQLGEAGGGADGAAAAGVVADLERLRLEAGQLADAAQDAGGHGVGGHVAVAVAADDDADVELGDVALEVVAEEVGVAGVGDVGGEEEGLGVGLANDAGAEGVGVQSLDGALDDGGQEVTPGALAQERANLLVVEESGELDVAFILVVARANEGHQGGPRAEFVVDAAGSDELAVEAERLRGLGVEELQLPVQDGAVRGNSQLLGDELDQLGGLGVDEGARGAQGLGLGVVGALQADDGHGLGLGVVLAHHADAKVGGERWDLCDGPAQLDELGGRLARLLVANDDAAADAEVAVPPGGVEAAGVGGDAELDVAGAVGLGAHGLELGREGVDVAGDDADAVARLVGLADLEGDKGAAVAGNPVLAAGLELASPGVARGKLDGRLASHTSCCFVPRKSTAWKTVGFSVRKSMKGFVNASGFSSETAQSWHGRRSGTAATTVKASSSVSLLLQLTHTGLAS